MGGDAFMQFATFCASNIGTICQWRWQGANIFGAAVHPSRDNVLLNIIGRCSLAAIFRGSFAAVYCKVSLNSRRAVVECRLRTCPPQHRAVWNAIGKHGLAASKRLKVCQLAAAWMPAGQ